MEFSDRLKNLRLSKKLTQEELSKLTGINKSSIGMYEAGKRAPKYAPLSVLADFFHVSTDYLLGHESNSTYSKQINAKFPFIVLPKDKNYIPVLGSVKCGLNAPTDEHIEEYIGIDDKYRADEMIGFYAEGDSMEPEIHDGDICLVHLQEDVPDGALAVVVICDGVEEAEGTIKRIHKADGAIILQATNQAYAPRIFTGENANKVRIVGRVVEVRHKTV